MCSLDPATEFSVFGDETEGLLTPEGPPWVPPADRGPDGGGAAGGPPVPPPPGGSDDDEPPLDDDELARRVAEELVPLLDSGVEHLVILDRAGRELARAEGHETDVALPDGDWHGTVVAHTHTAGLTLELEGMDPNDVYLTASQRLHAGAVAYRYRDRVFVQLLTAPLGEWPDPATLAETLVAMCSEVGLQQRERLLDQAEDPMHLALERVAAALRLGYRRYEAVP